ncbi:MAG TPA: cell division protein ZapA [Methylibium sp.]|nr:cell division protein ZapA [Methylibium sp.]
MKQVEVTIMGQSYRLVCPEGGERALHEAVAHVDREMCGIRDSGKVKARERIAVLAALNLAFSLAERDARAPAAAPGSTPHDEPAIDVLIARIDEALGSDGRLL